VGTGNGRCSASDNANRGSSLEATSSWRQNVGYTLPQIQRSAQRAREYFKRADAEGNRDGSVDGQELRNIGAANAAVFVHAPPMTLKRLESDLDWAVTRVLRDAQPNPPPDRVVWDPEVLEHSRDEGLDDFERDFWWFMEHELFPKPPPPPAPPAPPHPLEAQTDLAQALRLAEQEGPRTRRGNLQVDSGEAAALVKLAERRGHRPEDLALLVGLLHRLTHVDRPATVDALSADYDAENALEGYLEDRLDSIPSIPAAGPAVLPAPASLSPQGKALWDKLQALIVGGPKSLQGSNLLSPAEAGELIAMARADGLTGEDLSVLIEAADRLTHLDLGANDYDVVGQYATEDLLTDVLCANAALLPKEFGLVGSRICGQPDDGLVVVM
jgi:hypothetical protein